MTYSMAVEAYAERLARVRQRLVAVSDYVTASVPITGQVRRRIDRVHLLTQAIAKVQDAAEAGGNLMLALTE